MFLPDDSVGGYEVFDVKQNELIAIFYINPLSQAKSYFKAEDLAYELNTKYEKKEMTLKRKGAK